jgi:hypothetical protein
MHAHDRNYGGFVMFIAETLNVELWLAYTVYHQWLSASLSMSKDIHN